MAITNIMYLAIGDRIPIGNVMYEVQYVESLDGVTTVGLLRLGTSETIAIRANSSTPIDTDD